MSPRLCLLSCASTVMTVMAAFEGKVTKPGDWKGLYNEEKELLMVNYYDYDRNIGWW